MSANSSHGAPWPTAIVGDHFQIQLGKMLDSSKDAGELKPYLGNRAIRWGHIDLSALSHVPLTPREQSKYILKRNDLLVCEGGEVGRAAIWNEELPECYYQKALHRLRSISHFDPRIMLALLEYWSMSNGFADYVTQTSIAHLPREKFLKMPLPVIPLDEQERMGEIIDDVNGLVACLERLITKKQAIKQGMMQKLLEGSARLSGFSETWSSVCLGDVATMSSGGTPPSGNASFYGGQIPWVSISDMTRSGKYVRSTEKTLSQKGLANSAARLYDADSVLYAMYASLGECALPVGRMASSQAILGILPVPDQLDREFLYYSLSARKAQVKELGQQGTQSNLNAGMVRDFILELPSFVEQRAIAAVLSDVDWELELLDDRLRKARDVRLGMMQELLTGRTRLVPQGVSA